MIVAPSVLSLDYSDTKKQLDELKKSKATWLHFDVMDGHFVKNLSFGPHVLTTLKKDLDLFIDVHIMVDNPWLFQQIFIEAGADGITFHLEACKDDDDCFKLIKEIKKKGKKVGLSIKPNTKVSSVKKFIKDLDLVLIMSVEPGFGGQSFIEESIDKIKELKKLIEQSGSSALIEVDGGINEETGLRCKNAGADVLVAGSYIFNNDIVKAVETLC
ncbi:MAG: ribulose-phosphate 3-epimerase [Erysipelotrichaceae bacterium]|nr:ribulose-phosphate 3-epimerase [Erysipelotrichaceae bacterium]